MSRLPRYFVEDQPLHVIQRGNDRQPMFFADDDLRLFRKWLGEGAAAYGCAIHAYVFMTNHIHLLLTPRRRDSLPRLMQSLGRRYVRHVNDMHGRTGTLWEGRYRATPVETDAYLLRCHVYIELNPVRAGMVEAPGAYIWSSYRTNALGVWDDLVTPHPLYAALDTTDADRRRAYRDLFAGALDEAFLVEIREATNGGWALGSEAFRQRIAAAAGRRSGKRPRGRVARASPLAGQLALL
jgi:putative transposase